MDILPFNPISPIIDPACGCRLSLNWDDYYGDDPVAASALEWVIAMAVGRFFGEKNFFNRVWRQFREKFEPEEYYELFFEADRLAELRSLVIGNWHLEREGTVAIILERLIENAAKLPNLRSLLLGDISEADGPVESLQMDDISSFLAAFPQLETLQIRGTNGLRARKLSHSHLRELKIQTGEVSRELLGDLLAADLPNLERLEFIPAPEITAAELQSLYDGQLFPNLKPETQETTAGKEPYPAH